MTIPRLLERGSFCWTTRSRRTRNSNLNLVSSYGEAHGPLSCRASEIIVETFNLRCAGADTISKGQGIGGGSLERLARPSLHDKWAIDRHDDECHADCSASEN